MAYWAYDARGRFGDIVLGLFEILNIIAFGIFNCDNFYHASILESDRSDTKNGRANQLHEKYGVVGCSLVTFRDSASLVRILILKIKNIFQ